MDGPAPYVDRTARTAFTPHKQSDDNSRNQRTCRRNPDRGYARTKLPYEGWIR